MPMYSEGLKRRRPAVILPASSHSLFLLQICAVSRRGSWIHSIGCISASEPKPGCHESASREWVTSLEETLEAEIVWACVEYVLS